MIAFSGPARPAVLADYQAAATQLGIGVPLEMAIARVESGGMGGFLTDGSGRPRILFEAEHFHALTGGAYDQSHPNISSPTWNPRLYYGGSAEYLRLSAAVLLNETAALRSTSWGMFQIMGANWQSAGFSTLAGFVAAMEQGEAEHLAAFAALCKANQWDGYLQHGNLAGFSAHWNGPGYRADGYVQKLQAALRQAEADMDGTLTIGARGAGVQALQVALNGHGASGGTWLTEDSIFGPATQIAVRRFQADHALKADGIVGAETRAALGLPAGASA